MLEIGCGNCRNLLGFVKSGFECHGIDFSKKMLEYAKKYCRKHNFKVRLQKARAEKLPYIDNSFEYVLSIATLHHLNPTQQKKAITEMWRVLKRDGIAFIAVWNRKATGKISQKEAYVPWKIKGKTYLRYYYFFSLAELKALFKKANFKILKAKENKNLMMVVKKI